MKITVKAERKLAYDSADHLHPWGTRNDNSRNRRFNSKIYSFYPRLRELKILDLGCAGGGFVADCLDAGHIAVGLEGSDFSQKRKRAEWAHIPEFLFTCDITYPFDIVDANNRILFDYITAWEVMEHIKESDMPKVIANIKKHLLPTGLLILSITDIDDMNRGVNLHQTVRPKDWWIAKFKEYGFEYLEKHLKYFNGQFIRGGKYDGPHSFNLVLSYSPKDAPPIPELDFKNYLFDIWYGSKAQKYLKRLIV